MIFKILLPILISSSVFAFDKDFKTVNDRVPLEFSHLFESMKLGAKSPSDKIKLVGLCKDLDENLGSLQKEHIFFLMKSEVIKNVLEYRFSKVRSFDVTSFLISRLEEDFEKKKGLLNSFSQWIWRSIIAELKYRQKIGLITNRSFSSATFQDSKKAEAIRFEKYLTYLLPWIDKMDSLSAAQFNDLTKDVSWIILQRLNERSLLFKRYASTATTDTKITIFNIPSKLLELHPQDLKRMQNDEDVPLTLKDESRKEKIEAFEDVQSATLDDMSPLSDEVSKELDEKAP